SAVVVAGVRIQGSAAERVSVRPVGHPNDPSQNFTAGETPGVRGQGDGRGSFLVFDEGPGRSGSTFLSVAEALVRTGVPVERITLLGSHETDPQLLCAPDAARRWLVFRFRAAQGTNRQFERCTYIGAGEWRGIFVKQTS